MLREAVTPSSTKEAFEDEDEIRKALSGITVKFPIYSRHGNGRVIAVNFEKCEEKNNIKRPPGIWWTLECRIEDSSVKKGGRNWAAVGRFIRHADHIIIP